MRSLYPNISRILVFVLFSNIFYFLVGVLSLQLDVARYACVTKTGNLLDNKTNSV